MKKHEKKVNSSAKDYKGDEDMLATQKKSSSGLTREKKEILRKAMGAASSKTVILSKIRDEWKNENN